MKIFFFLFFFFSFTVFANIPWEKLRTGDIILLSLECRVCSLIELEEGLPYSHMALVYRDKKNILKLVESWGSAGVKAKTVTEFFQDKKLNSKNTMIVLRHKKLLNTKKYFFEVPVILENFLNKKYDPHFLWDNKDQDQEPMYYCSEFIYKFFQSWLDDNFKMKTKKMTFSKYYSHWVQYFKALKQKVPAGKEGISPADFAKTSDFLLIFNGGVHD